MIRKKGDGNRWMLVELCDKMEDLTYPCGKIPQAKEPVESITLVHAAKIEEPEMVGKVLEMTKMFTEEEKKMMRVVTSSKNSWRITSLKVALSQFPKAEVWKRRVTSSRTTSYATLTLA